MAGLRSPCSVQVSPERRLDPKSHARHRPGRGGDMYLVLARLYASGAIIIAILAFQQIVEIDFLLVWISPFLRMGSVQQ